MLSEDITAGALYMRGQNNTEAHRRKYAEESAKKLMENKIFKDNFSDWFDNIGINQAIKESEEKKKEPEPAP